MHTHESPVIIQIQVRHIDPKKDVSVSDCESLINPINEAIRNSAIINQSFLLEISSCGISDLLIEDRDFNTFKGFPVEVTFQNKKKHSQVELGLLHERSENYLQINLTMVVVS